MLKHLLLGRADSSQAQFLRSVLVSNVSFALDFSICLLLVGRLKLNYVLATALSFTAGTVLNYLLTVAWIFDNRPMRKRRLEFSFFILLSAIGLGLNSLCMLIFTGLLRLHYLLSRVVSATSVFFFNYFCRKYILFRDSRLVRLLSRIEDRRG